jgi:hypothetical protein
VILTIPAARRVEVEVKVTGLQGLHIGAAHAAHGCYDGGESVALLDVGCLADALTRQEFGNDVVLDGKLQQAWVIRCH